MIGNAINGKRIFEQGLDYGVGIAVMNHLIAFGDAYQAKYGKRNVAPKTIKVEVDDQGNCRIVK